MKKRRRSLAVIAVPYQLVLKRPINRLSVKRENVPVGEIPGDPTADNSEKICFRELTRRFLRSLSSFVNIEDENAGLKLGVHPINCELKDEVRCVVKSGKYGYAAELYDITAKGKNAQRRKNHCELLPFACRFVFSGARTTAILVIEKFGPHSIIGILETAFNGFLESSGYHNWRVVFSPVSSMDYIQRHLDYTANSFHLLGRQIPKDLVNCLGIDKLGKEFDAAVDLKVTIKRKHLNLKTLRDRMMSRIGDGLTINEAKFDGVSAEVRVAGKLRKVYLNDLENFLIQLDVSDRVEYDNDGHPKPESFYKAAEEGVRIAKKELGGWDND